MEWYEASLDCMRISQRVLTTGADSIILPKHRSLFGLDPAAASQQIENAKAGLERLAVLDLAAVFERTIRLHLLGEYGRAFVGGTPLLDAVLIESKLDIEFWNIAERLLTVFPGVNDRVRGKVKQVIAFRNWVAHGKRIDQLPPVNLTPEDAYQRLTEFLEQLGLSTP